MAQAKDPLNPPRPAGYDKASPEEIVADIERTRARMDETLAQLGRALKPRLPAKAALVALGALSSLAAAAFLGFAAYRGYRRRHSLPGRLARTPGFRRLVSGAKWSARSVSKAAPALRKAGLGEQALLAARIALAARGGKTAILVVEPRGA